MVVFVWGVWVNFQLSNHGKSMSMTYVHLECACWTFLWWTTWRGSYSWTLEVESWTPYSQSLHTGPWMVGFILSIASMSDEVFFKGQTHQAEITTYCGLRKMVSKYVTRFKYCGVNGFVELLKVDIEANTQCKLQGGMVRCASNLDDHHPTMWGHACTCTSFLHFQGLITLEQNQISLNQHTVLPTLIKL